MIVNRLTPLNTLEIWSPKYKDRTVLIASYKVKEQNKIVFTKAKHLLGREYYMSGSDIRSYPTTTNGKVTCFSVPLDDLEPLEYRENN